MDLFFNLNGIPHISKKYYHESVIPSLFDIVDDLREQFLKDCKKTVKNRSNLKLMIDAGWSHPGWWARECTVIAINQENGLPIAIQHVLQGKNYFGSARGCQIYIFSKLIISLGMEGWAVEQIMKKLKAEGFIVTSLLHDKDASTMKHTLAVFDDVTEALCLGIYILI